MIKAITLLATSNIMNREYHSPIKLGRKPTNFTKYKRNKTIVISP